MTITYNGINVTVSNQIITPTDIIAILNDPNILEKNGTIWLLKKSITIDNSSSFNITNYDTTEFRLLSLNDSSSVVMTINGTLNVENITELSSWNTLTSSKAPNTDTIRSYIIFNGTNSKGVFKNTTLSNLGYDTVHRGIKADLGISIEINNVNLINIYDGVILKDTYGASSSLIKDSSMLRFQSLIDNTIFDNNIADGGIMIKDADNGVISNSISNYSTWNGIDLDGTFNSIIYNCKATNSSHNGFQIGTLLGNKLSSYNLIKNCEAYSLAGTTSGSNGYYISWYAIPGTEPHDNILEDITSHDLAAYMNGIRIEGVYDTTIRRYNSWNITDTNIDILYSNKVNIIDSNVSNVGIRVYESRNINLINTISEIKRIEEGDITYCYYLNIHVIDINGNPIQNAIVTIPTQSISIIYPDIPINTFNLNAINLYGTIITTPLINSKVLKPQPITLAYTDINGNTPPPSDNDNTIILPSSRHELHGSPWYSRPYLITNFIYSITVSKDGHQTTINDVTPNNTWHRTNPYNIPQEGNGSITIILDNSNPCPSPICNIQIQ